VPRLADTQLAPADGVILDCLVGTLVLGRFAPAGAIPDHEDHLTDHIAEIGLCNPWERGNAAQSDLAAAAKARTNQPGAAGESGCTPLAGNSWVSGQIVWSRKLTRWSETQPMWFIVQILQTSL